MYIYFPESIAIITVNTFVFDFIDSLNTLLKYIFRTQSKSSVYLLLKIEFTRLQHILIDLYRTK